MMGITPSSATPWWMGPWIMILIPVAVIILVLSLVLFIVPQRRLMYDNSELDIFTDEERKVIDVLIRSGGQALQKDIARSLGLSRVKTHRIITSLKKRGVVAVKNWGNTNLIQLNEQLMKKTPSMDDASKTDG